MQNGHDLPWQSSTVFFRAKYKEQQNVYLTKFKEEEQQHHIAGHAC